MSPIDPSPSVVVGELQHPTAPRKSAPSSWLVIPNTGLYMGVVIVGGVGADYLAYETRDLDAGPVRRSAG